MGAAEYEFGAVPEALHKIANSKTLAVDQIIVPYDEIPDPWRSKKSEAFVAPGAGATIYLLAPAEMMDEVKERANDWARDTGPELRDGTQLIRALKPIEEWDKSRVGWLELNNGFMFFTDREMWEQTANLFGVQLGTVA